MRGERITEARPALYDHAGNFLGQHQTPEDTLPQGPRCTAHKSLCYYSRGDFRHAHDDERCNVL